MVVVLDVGGVVVVVVGFTMVVFVSFFSAGEEVVVGATTSVLCSQAPRSAALAKMQSNFFIVWIGCPILGLSWNRMGETLRPYRTLTFRSICPIP